MINGAIAGLVCITPAAGYVDMTGAFFIGFFGGPLCYGGIQLKHKLGTASLELSGAVQHDIVCCDVVWCDTVWCQYVYDHKNSDCHDKKIKQDSLETFDTKAM